MLLILWGTGMAGFLLSFLLLRAGLSAMWLRYPLAVGLAYGVFLALLRVWLSYQESRQAPSASVSPRPEFGHMADVTSSCT